MPLDDTPSPSDQAQLVERDAGDVLLTPIGACLLVSSPVLDADELLADYVLREATLRAIAFCTATANLFMSMILAVMVLFLIRDLRVPAYATGVIVAAAGIGGLLAAATTRRWVAALGQRRVVVLSLLATQPFALLAPLAEPGVTVVVFVLAWLILGYGSTLYNVAQVSYRQAVCPDALLGRVNAANRFLAWGTPPIGGLLASVLADHIGLRATLWIAAGGFDRRIVLVAGLAVARIACRVRWRDAVPIRLMIIVLETAGENDDQITIVNLID